MRAKVQCNDCGAVWIEEYPDGLDGDESYSSADDPKPCDHESQYEIMEGSDVVDQTSTHYVYDIDRGDGHPVRDIAVTVAEPINLWQAIIQARSYHQASYNVRLVNSHGEYPADIAISEPAKLDRHSAIAETIAPKIQIEEARGWLMDLGCDLDELDGRSDAEVQQEVNRKYDGGWTAFLRDFAG